MLQFRVVQFVDAAACQHDRIDTLSTKQRCLPMAEAFSNHAFDAVALNSAAHVLLGYNKPEARVIETIDTSKDQQLFTGNPQFGAIEDLLKVSGRQQSQRFGKPYLNHCAATQSSRLDGDPMTTFGATARQHFTTIGGRHTGAKTMDASTFQIAWLKSSFHGDVTPNDSMRRPICRAALTSS